MCDVFREQHHTENETRAAALWYLCVCKLFCFSSLGVDMLNTTAVGQGTELRTGADFDEAWNLCLTHERNTGERLLVHTDMQAFLDFLHST
jgi:hypothetical protein